MTSPVETIADALVSFILSLLNDPKAADDFASAPQAALASNGLQKVCMADVAAAKPVVVDHPNVTPTPMPPPPPPGPPTPETEIIRMIQQFTSIDARSTIVDQSVNQNIWTNGGDVTQLFDQEAVIASGDDAVAAGDDATLTDSDIDVTIGDVAIGNEHNEGSFNQTGVDPAPDAEPVADAAPVADVAPIVEEVLAVAEPAPAPVEDASVPEPADVLEADMTATADVSYETDAASAAVPEQPLEDPVEEN